MNRLMDDFTESHLAAWADDYWNDEAERQRGLQLIRRLVALHPELLETKSWPQMYEIASAPHNRELQQ